MSIANFLNVNRSLTNVHGEVRHYSLPRTNPFPKLDQRIVARRVTSEAARPAVIIGRNVARSPEMVTDVIDASTSYAVENVRRERSGTRFGFGQMVGWMLGGRRAARP